MNARKAPIGQSEPTVIYLKSPRSSLPLNDRESFQSHSISDSFRLGKFSIDCRRPRPILVKLLRFSDVSNILDLLPSPTPSSRIYLWKNGNENLPSSRKDVISSSQALSVSPSEYTTSQFSSTTSCTANLISLPINFIAVLP